MIPIDAGTILLPLARSSIQQALGEKQKDLAPTEKWLFTKTASFVTLHKNQDLRGCIGTIDAHRSLIEDVRSNAISAAFRDPRFPSLQSEELNQIHIEVSVLSIPEQIFFENEAHVLTQLKVGIDGIVLEWRGHRSTFLPQVWELLSEPREFLSHLKRKAGLSADFWAPDINLFCYNVSKWSE